MIKNEGKFNYDVIVIGAGHAGCEAALASARNGAGTLLISINMDSIALMPYSSAVGGFGRGQLIREIDVLGGEISRNIDKNYIHMRTATSTEDPAIGTLEAVVDKRRYFLSMKEVLENQNNLYLRQGLVVGIEGSRKKYNLYTSDGIAYCCKSIVICTGTFLGAKIFWGGNVIEAGRQGEICSKKLLVSLENLGFKFGRLKNYTAPLIDRKSINVKVLEKQSYDRQPQMFSYENNFDGRSQLHSYITNAGKDCTRYILKSINKKEVNSCEIKSKTTEGCFPIEDKVLKLEDKKGYMVSILPVGRDTNEVYLKGLETALSEEIQVGMLKKIKGLKGAEITRPGYGVEYKYLLPFQLTGNLESKKFKGIFFGGHINGTYGYEESAAQGIVAGLNASRKSKNLDSIIIRREDGYIGVLVSDLVVKGVNEPYRMLVSRNEYSFYHRHDNADIRMLKFLEKLGNKDKAIKIIKKYKKTGINVSRET